MNNYLDTFINGYTGYFNYLMYEIANPNLHNYFYWLLLVSVFFFALEWFAPWRKDQAKFRKDFWLDVFYMFFNFFLFSLIIYNAASDVIVLLLHDLLDLVGITNLVAIEVQSWALWAHLLLGFVVRDFVQWNIHRLLHRTPFLWEFHKVHHSVEEMGFAAHLRYHWMENVVYRSLEYLPLALIGIGLNDFFIIHIFTLAVGHYNHSNISVSGRVTGSVFGLLVGIFIVSQWGYVNSTENVLLLIGTTLFGFGVLSHFMKYLFNSPEMHIWHHAYELPENHPHGMNYGLTLACWDYLFGTAYIPHNGRDIRLGFPGVEDFPDDFVGQNLNGFGRKSAKK
ncbi:MAG: sterol desaturase family protein [Chitinophagales bacterium]